MSLMADYCVGVLGWRLGAVIMFRREQAQLGQARMGIIRHNRAGNGPKVVIMRC